MVQDESLGGLRYLVGLAAVVIGIVGLAACFVDCTHTCVTDENCELALREFSEALFMSGFLLIITSFLLAVLATAKVDMSALSIFLLICLLSFIRVVWAIPTFWKFFNLCSSITSNFVTVGRAVFALDLLAAGLVIAAICFIVSDFCKSPRLR